MRAGTTLAPAPAQPPARSAPHPPANVAVELAGPIQVTKDAWDKFYVGAAVIAALFAAGSFLILWRSLTEQRVANKALSKQIESQLSLDSLTIMPRLRMWAGLQRTLPGRPWDGVKVAVRNYGDYMVYPTSLAVLPGADTSAQQMHVAQWSVIPETMRVPELGGHRWEHDEAVVGSLELDDGTMDALLAPGTPMRVRFEFHTPDRRPWAAVFGLDDAAAVRKGAVELRFESVEQTDRER